MKGGERGTAYGVEAPVLHNQVIIIIVMIDDDDAHSDTDYDDDDWWCYCYDIHSNDPNIIFSGPHRPLQTLGDNDDDTVMMIDDAVQ